MWNFSQNDWRIKIFSFEVEILPLEIARVNVSLKLRANSDPVRTNVSIDRNDDRSPISSVKLKFTGRLGAENSHPGHEREITLQFNKLGDHFVS